MTSTRIAVTGATGELGGRVARKLAERDISQRLIVREPSRAPDLPGAEVAAASYDDRDAMAQALEGLDTVFFVSGFESAEREELHRSAIRAFIQAGIKRVVYTSFLGAAPNATFTFAQQHFTTEQDLIGAGLETIALRNSLYLDVLPYLAAEGEIRGPAGDGHFAPVARDDIADVAVAALLDPSIAAGSHDVTGLQRMTMADVAELLSSVYGKRVQYINESEEEAYASRAHFEATDYEKQGWVTSYQAIANGEMDVVSDTVERLAGHKPIAPRAFLESVL